MDGNTTVASPRSAEGTKPKTHKKKTAAPLPPGPPPSGPPPNTSKEKATSELHKTEPPINEKRNVTTADDGQEPVKEEKDGEVKKVPKKHSKPKETAAPLPSGPPPTIKKQNSKEEMKSTADETSNGKADQDEEKKLSTKKQMTKEEIQEATRKAIKKRMKESQQKKTEVSKEKDEEKGGSVEVRKDNLMIGGEKDEGITKRPKEMKSVEIEKTKGELKTKNEEDYKKTKEETIVEKSNTEIKMKTMEEAKKPIGEAKRINEEVEVKTMEPRIRNSIPKDVDVQIEDIEEPAEPKEKEIIEVPKTKEESDLSPEDLAVMRFEFSQFMLQVSNPPSPELKQQPPPMSKEIDIPETKQVAEIQRKSSEERAEQKEETVKKTIRENSTKAVSEGVIKTEIQQSKEEPSNQNEKAPTKANRTPVKQRNFDYFDPRRVPASSNEIIQFLCSPLFSRRGTIIKCFIERNESATNKIAPVYSLLLEINSSSGRPILFAKKRPSSTPHYVISLEKDDLTRPRHQRSDQYIGKLRGFRENEYILYDNGESPEEEEEQVNLDYKPKDLRKELLAVRYSSSKKDRATRKIELAIPAINEDTNTYYTYQPISSKAPSQSLFSKFSELVEIGEQNVRDKDKVICFHKRETKYDPLSSCIVDFRSRATCVSIKNLQLVHSQPTNQNLMKQYIKLNPSYYYVDEGTVSVPQEHVILQMGKVGKDCFNVDFQYPFSPLQAFAMCLTRFDTNIK